MLPSRAGEASREATMEGGKDSALRPVEKVKRKEQSPLVDKHERRPRVEN